MARVIAFDVNETLLDLRALDPDFVQIFGEAAARREWFSQMLQSALVATVTGVYTDFGSTGIAALDMLAERRGITLTEADRQRIREGMRRLPPHNEARASLERLRDAGLRMVTLTNSTEAVATAQITNAGLLDLFEQVFSADTVQRLKPAPEPYHMVAARLGVQIGQVRLVAAHAWDIAGALRAGCAAAFVARPGMVLDPLVEQPDIIGSDLRDIADQIIAVECE
jgi:2-haloacid dehalogenase